MSLPAAFARVAALEAMVQQVVAPQQPAYRERSVASTTLASPYLGTSSLTGTTSSTPAFVNALQSALAPTATGDTGGTRALAIAQGEIGVQEEPPGSNDSPRIAEYRTATAGAYAGAPWCAYFVSWAAAQAGAPIGDNGSGEGAVEGITAWAEKTGRLLPASAEPQPGDLILFGGAHVGIVESVNADGSLTTVEGNHSQAVERVTRQRSEATGWVRL
jgi:CHAP domain